MYAIKCFTYFRGFKRNHRRSLTTQSIFHKVRVFLGAELLYDSFFSVRPSVQPSKLTWENNTSTSKTITLIFYVLYFIFYILYFMFYILYFIFYILYFIFYILYFIFYILYFTFHILYFEIFGLSVT